MIKVDQISIFRCPKKMKKSRHEMSETRHHICPPSEFEWVNSQKVSSISHELGAQETRFLGNELRLIVGDVLHP